MFGYFYQQTEYSMLKNIIKLEEYIIKAKEYGYTFLTITDENLHGSFKFYELCIKNDIKPVIGLKIDVLLEDTTETILLYAKNYNGLKNLFKISSLEKINLKNNISYKDLLKNNSDLLLITTLEESKLNDYILKDGKKAYDFYLSLLSLVNEVYIGVDINSKSFDLNMNFITKYNLNAVIISKTSYILKEDYDALNYLRKIGKVNEKVLGNSLYTKETYNLLYNNYQFLIENTNLLASNININWQYNKLLLPIYEKNIVSYDYLKALAYKGLLKRLNNVKNDIYLKRLEYELEIINKMGFSDYFLIVWDAVKYAKNNDIMIGPGRGSAAGSLVSYCLGITEIDPIKYNLLFERFLNLGRKSMPDIDIDIQDTKRDELITYMKNKYGYDHVSLIVTFQEFQFRGAIRDIAKIFNLKNYEIDEIIKNFDNQDNINFLINRNPKIKQLFNIVNRITELPRQTGTHAAGIILSDQSMFGLIPLQQGINDLMQTQYEAIDLEKLGFLKIDFLGIRNLTMIKNVLNMVKKELNININPNNIPLDDKNTFKILNNADTLGIFQLESDGIRRVIKKMQINNFLDLVNLIALYRPGPMDNIDEFILRKNGKKVDYFIPELEPILKETYGIILYQEQIMLIAQKYANYSFLESDVLRKAISKKNQELMIDEKNNFIKKAILNGKNEAEANKLFDYILKFANYGFNKSHAVAYAFLAYQMLYLKANFTKYFLCVMLNNVIGNDLQTLKYINNAKEYNIDVLRPNINKSENCYIIEDNMIRMPLLVIKNLGLISQKEIIDNRHDGYKSYKDFILKVDLSQNVLENLIYSGAFNDFSLTKKQMISLNDKNKLLYSDLVNDLIIDESEYEKEFLDIKEKNALGFNLNENPIIKYYQYYKKYNPVRIHDFNKNIKNKINTICYIKAIKKVKNSFMVNISDFSLNINFFIDNVDLLNINDLCIFTVIPYKNKEFININVLSIKKIKKFGV